MFAIGLSRWRLALFLLAIAPTPLYGQRFQALGPEIADLQTGLVWQRCSVGLLWRDQHCLGKAGHFTWDEARGMGRDGWRLPEPDELGSLIDRARKERGQMPKIDTTAFPDTLDPEPQRYWAMGYRNCVSNSRQGCGTAVEFSFAVHDDTFLEPREMSFRVRLVRAGTTAAAGTGTVERGLSPDGRFDLLNGVAHDRKTGLYWQRCMEGQRYVAGTGCTGVVATFVYGAALRLSHDGWRVPGIDELKSLIDPARMKAGSAPYINIFVFPIPQPDYGAYLTVQPYGPNDAWCVDFHVGTASNCGRTYPHPVRLVRITAP